MRDVTAVLTEKRPPRADRTRMETLILDADAISKWRTPPFQRPLRINDKVRAIAEKMKRDEVIAGVITLGAIERGRDAGLYLVDGQHRVEAFRIAAVAEVFADVRVVVCEDMAEMGELFVELNSALVVLRPDDVLRGMEGRIAALGIIRSACPFVGYDQIKRNAGHTSAVVGMSMLIRSWHGSAAETPNLPSVSAIRLAEATTEEDAAEIVAFLKLAYAAWGREQGSWRLWAGLNLTLTAWLWRRLIGRTRPTGARHIVATPEEFKRAMMSAAAADYNEWLLGRRMSERDRAPAYARLKAIFSKRIAAERGVSASSVKMPHGPWET